MKRLSLLLLLLSIWMLAQVSAANLSQNTSPQSAPQSDKSPATSDKSGDVIEGCLSGAADVFKLTDATGKTYELTGDTHGLDQNVGHKVRLFGHVGSTGGGAMSSDTGPQATFGVKKMQSLSDACK